MGQAFTGSLTTSGNLGATSIGGALAGTWAIAGSISSLIAGGDLSASITTTGQGNLGATHIAGTLSGALHIHGSLASLTIGQDLSGTLTTTGAAGPLSVTGNLTGPVTLGGALASLTTGGNVTSLVTVSGDLGSLNVGGDLTAPSIIHVHGSLSGHAVISGSLLGQLIIDGALHDLSVGHDLSGTLTTGSNAGPVTIGGNLSGAVSINGTLTSLSVGQDFTGTLTTVGNTGSLAVACNFSGHLNIGGSLASLTVSGNNTGISAVAADLTTLAFTGDFTGSLTIPGNIDTLTIHGNLAGNLAVNGNVNTSITVGANLSRALDIAGSVNAMNVGGDLSGQASIAGSVASLDLGNLSSTLTITGGLGTALIHNSLSGTLTVGAAMSSLTVTGDLSGNVTVGGDLPTIALGNLSGALTVAGSVTTLAINNNLAGALNIAGSIASAIINGPLTAPASLTVGGALGTLALGGADQGTITAGSIASLTIAHATPDSQGLLMSLTQGGIFRSITATTPLASATTLTASAVSGLDMAISYDGVGAPNTQAALRINHDPAPFDLTLTSPATDWLDLSRLDAAPSATAPGAGGLNVRNIIVEGSLLRGITPSQAAYFGLAASASGGVILPGDNLATVAVRDQLPANSITAASIQGLAFGALADPTGALHSANAIVASPQGKQLLLSALAINPQTGKPYAKILADGNPPGRDRQQGDHRALRRLGGTQGLRPPRHAPLQRGSPGQHSPGPRPVRLRQSSPPRRLHPRLHG